MPNTTATSIVNKEQFSSLFQFILLIYQLQKKQRLVVLASQSCVKLAPPVQAWHEDLQENSLYIFRYYHQIRTASGCAARVHFDK